MAMQVQGRSMSPPPSYDDVIRETSAIVSSTRDCRNSNPGSLCTVLDLPSEMISNILQYLSVSDRKDAALVCRKWYEASLHPLVQKDIIVSVKSSVTHPRPFTGLGNRAGFHLALSDIDGSPNSVQLLQACEASLSSRLLTLSLKGSNVSQSVLVAMLRKCSNVTSLDVSCCNTLTLNGSDLAGRMNGISLPHLEQLNLSSLRHLTDANLAAFLHAAPNLRNLELCSAPFLFSSSCIYSEVSSRPNSAALTFNRFLYELSKLTPTMVSLNLSRTTISNGALMSLAKVPSLKLETLGLVSCKDITDSAIIALSRAQPYIRRLDLALNAQLTAVSVKHIASNLRLDYLNLTKVRLYAKETNLLTHFTTCSHLVLSSTVMQPVQADEAEKIFQTWSQPMRYLDLSYCAGLSNTVFVSMCHYLLHLTELNVSSCFRLDDITLREISKCLVNLTALNASWCKHLTDMGLLGVFHTEFTHNCADNCRCGRDRNVSYFEYTPPVRDIAPRELVPTSEHIKSAIAQHGDVGQFPISRLTKLKSLDLSVCSKITDRSIVEVLSFANLQSLDLSMCPRLTDAALLAIAANNPLLERVSIAQCREVSDQGVYALLASCRRLLHLNISGCARITDSTMESLARRRVKLKSLDISLCNISIEAIDRLERLMPSLQTIHKRYTSANDPQKY